jgi:hypothetical protein
MGSCAAMQFGRQCRSRAISHDLFDGCLSIFGTWAAPRFFKRCPNLGYLKNLRPGSVDLV